MPLPIILNKQLFIIMKHRVTEYNLNNFTYSLRFLITSMIFSRPKMTGLPFVKEDNLVINKILLYYNY